MMMTDLKLLEVYRMTSIDYPGPLKQPPVPSRGIAQVASPLEEG